MFYSEADIVEGDTTIVELGALRDVEADDMTCRKGVLQFDDVGIDDDIARARIVTFNIFSGSFYGCVPVLRFSTPFDRGRGVCLSQVMAGSQCTPRMGETAFVSPVTERLLENEMDIALNAFIQVLAA